jgi:hypothetical protein
MDKLKVWERIGYGLFAIAGCAALVLIGCSVELNKSEWAYWVQAIGSVLAIFAVIWMATTQERVRREEKMTIARVVAAGMTFRLTMIGNEVERCMNRFDEVKVADGNPAGFQNILDDLSKIVPFPSEEIAKLAPLPKNCAFKVASAFDLIRSALPILENAVRNVELHYDSAFRKHQASILSFILSQALGCINLATKEMQSASHAFTSPFH